MKNNPHYVFKASFCIAIMFFLMTGQEGCTVKLIADHDAKIAREIIDISKQVDTFYGELLETPYSERSYDYFKDRYISTEVNIRSLVVQNRARPLNEESLWIAETILTKWLKYKEEHKKNWARYQRPESDGHRIEAEDIYKDALAENHRKRFTRLFTAMSIAEEAKKISEEKAENEGEQE